MARLPSLVLAVSALAWTGCGPTPTGVKLRAVEAQTAKLPPPIEPEHKRASFDLQCPPEKTKLSNLDSMSYGARGCGRQVRYMKRCRRCQWEPASAVTNVVTQ